MILRWNTPVVFARAVWHAVQYFWDGFPVIAPKAVIDSRFRICRDCPLRIEDQCGKCACFISVKTLLSSEQCPDQPPKWNRLTFKTNNSNDSHVA